MGSIDVMPEENMSVNKIWVGNDSSVEIRHRAILLSTNKVYREGRELYDVVRGVWRVDVNRAKKAEYAMAVYEGKVKGVFEIERWVQAKSEDYLYKEQKDKAAGRWGFVGKEAKDIWDEYVGKDVGRRGHGYQNPVRYENVPK